MFDASVYRQRREVLRSRLDKGVILLFANDESPANYLDNPYPFRQDSTFLYYFGLNDPGMIGVIDLDEGTERLYGYEYTLDDTIWMGPQPTLTARGALCGVGDAASIGDAAAAIRSWKKAGRQVHFLPPYRAEHDLKIQSMLGITPADNAKHASMALIRAIIKQRSVKTDAELAEIESAHAVTRNMHLTAMEQTRPGMYEYEVVAQVKRAAFAGGGGPSFTVIFSVHGETLHNHAYGNRMVEGQLVVHDSGAESATGYAADITRTFPVSGKFTSVQRDIYEIVLKAEESSISAIKPGVTNRDIHLLAAKIITEGLKSAGLMKGDVDSAVEQGAHALFFPHGIGHMMGLDVHDMENLGENFVGYDEKSVRSEQFGLASLRLARALEPGYVLTIEPGIYFIPALIDTWQSENRFSDFIDYTALRKYREFGGIRIEDDVVVTESGGKVIGKPIPKEPEEVEQTCRH